MWRVVVIACGLCACGRIGFDPSAVTSGDALALDDATLPAIPPGAALWLRMETDPAVVIVDSAKGHTVTCSAGCPIRITDPTRGNVYQFSGQQLTVAFQSDLNPSTGYTASVWLRLDTYPPTTSYACAFSKPWGPTNADDDTFAICVDEGSLLYTFTSSATGVDTLYGPSFPLATWHHVVTTWDAGTTLKTLYLDGVLVNSVGTDVTFDTDGVLVGADNLMPLWLWRGAIDEALLYDRVLSTSELAQLP